MFTVAIYHRGQSLKNNWCPEPWYNTGLWLATGLHTGLWLVLSDLSASDVLICYHCDLGLTSSSLQIILFMMTGSREEIWPGPCLESDVFTWDDEGSSKLMKASNKYTYCKQIINREKQNIYLEKMIYLREYKTFLFMIEDHYFINPRVLPVTCDENKLWSPWISWIS